MSDMWVFVAAVAVLLVAGAVLQRRGKSERTKAGRLEADAESQRPRDFVQEREDARRLALGGEGRDWEDASDRGPALNPERGGSAAQN